MVAQSGWAKTVTLFRPDGAGVENYSAVLESIHPGDTVRFGDGSEFTVGNRLGTGNQTAVFSLLAHPDRVIRIPVQTPDFPLDVTQAAITRYVRGYGALEEFDIPRVRIHQGVDRQFLIVERLPDDAIALRKWIRHPEAPAELRERATIALENFVKRAAGFGNIGDFTSDGAQLYYLPSRNEWILVDWDESHRPAFFQYLDRLKPYMRHYLRSPIYESLSEIPADAPTTRTWLKELRNRTDAAAQVERDRIDENLAEAQRWSRLEQSADNALHFPFISDACRVKFRSFGSKRSPFGSR